MREMQVVDLLVRYAMPLKPITRLLSCEIQMKELKNVY